MVASESQELVNAACLFVGRVGETCVDLLMSQKTLLDSFIEIYQAGLGDKRVLPLQVLSLIFGGSKDGEKVWKKLGPGVLETLIKAGKNSFDDIRLAAYACLMGMARWDWGVKEFAKDFSFSGFLCDRFGDDTKGGAEFRFEMIKQVLRTEGIEEIFGEADLNMFQVKLAYLLIHRRTSGKGRFIVRLLCL